MPPGRPFLLRVLDTGSLAVFATGPYVLLHFVLICQPGNLPFGDSLLPASVLLLATFSLILWRSPDVLVKIQRALLMGGMGFFLIFSMAPVMRHPVLAEHIARRMEGVIPVLGPLFRDGAGMMALLVVGLFWTMFCGVGFFFTKLLRQESVAPPPV